MENNEILINKSELNSFLMAYFKGKLSFLNHLMDGRETLGQLHSDLLKNVNPTKLIAQEKKINEVFNESLLKDFKECISNENMYIRTLKEILLNPPERGAEPAMTFAIHILARFYARYVNGEVKFNPATDFQTMLAVDLVVCQLVSSISIDIGTSERVLVEEKRSAKHNKETEEQKKKRWEEIILILEELQNDKKYNEKAFSISGVAHKISPKLKGNETVTTVSRDFKEHLVNTEKGKKYKISELLNICKTC